MASGKDSKNDKVPLKILCIHGYRQNDQAFRERTGAFRKIIKKHAELVFISAPNIVPADPGASADDTEDTKDGVQRGWWFSDPNDKFDAHDETQCCKGYEESLKVIEDAFREQGPFDGVLGFSQGASMVSLMCAIAEHKQSETPMKFQFAIIVAGFKSRSSGHDQLYSQPVSMPTLHVFGDTDRVIEKGAHFEVIGDMIGLIESTVCLVVHRVVNLLVDRARQHITFPTRASALATKRSFYNLAVMSEDLLKYFKEPIILNHSGGHFIPASGQHKKVYLEFLNNVISLKT